MTGERPETSTATDPGAASAVSANEATVAKPSVDASSRAVQASDPAPKDVTETVAAIDEAVRPLTVAEATGAPGASVVKESGPAETDSRRLFVTRARAK